MKTRSRIKDYKKGKYDIEFKMLLDDGVTCDDCLFCIRCIKMFGVKKTNTSCDFYPNRFVKKGVTEV